MRIVQYACHKSPKSPGYGGANPVSHRKRTGQIDLLPVYFDHHFDYIGLYRSGMFCFESDNQRHAGHDGDVVLCGAWRERRFVDVYKPAPVETRFVAVFICYYANVFDIRIDADNKLIIKELRMAVQFSFADCRHTGGAFLRGDLFVPPFSQGDISAHGDDIRVYRQFQRMRRSADRRIFIREVFYLLVGDRMRLLRFGHDCADRNIKFGLLERRSEKTVKDVTA